MLLKLKLYTHTGGKDLQCLGISTTQLSSINCQHIDITSLIILNGNMEWPSLKDIVLYLFGERIQDYELLDCKGRRQPHKCEIDAFFTIKCGRDLRKRKNLGLMPDTDTIRECD